MALTGFVYYWSRFRLDPTPRRDSYLVTLWITVVEMIGDAVLAWCSGSDRSSPRAGTRCRPPASTRASTRPSARASCWIGGDLVGLPFILLIVNRMSREDTGRRR